MESDIQVMTLTSYVQVLRDVHQVAVCVDLEDRTVSGRFVLEMEWKLFPL